MRKGKCKVVPVQVIKAYTGSGGLGLLILKIGTK
jgi:hypothetical protein